MDTSIVKLGQVDQGDKLGYHLHHAAMSGNKRQLRKILDKGMHVDYPNNFGQSPLFCACCLNEDSIVKELLRYGANPNERSNNGMTPLHMVSYSGNLKLMGEILAAGGDLRLHDANGRTAKEFAILQPDAKKRMKMLEFIEKTRLFALTKSGRDLRASANVPIVNRVPPRTNSVIRLIRDKILGDSSINLDHQMKSCHSMGFGKVYQEGDSFSGIICTLPLVSENLLKHDTQGYSFNNGAFMVMESMLWKNTKITVKRLHRDTAPGGEVDLLINEAEYIGKLRHPNILMLMGVCQTNNLESMVLLFERIELGSLYDIQHQKLERLSTSYIQEITVQICSALVFLHEQNIIHCFVTSHAIMLVTGHCAKLANFEYVVDREGVEIGRKSFVNQNMHQNVSYNWMSPEVMRSDPPIRASDVYSFSVVIWEMVHGEVPWGKYDTETVRYKLLEAGEQLEVESDKIPEVFKIILQYGLQLDPLHRKLQMYNILNLLTIPKENVKQYMEKLLRLEEESRQQTSVKPNRPPTTWKQDGSNNVTPRNRSDKSSPSPRVHTGRSNSVSPNAKSSPRHLPEDERYVVRRIDHNQSSKDPEYLHNNKLRFVDRMNFNHRKLDWELKEEQQGQDFYYTVRVNKENEEKNIEQSESEDGSLASDHGINKSMATKFSYLRVQQSPPGRCVKPASHCTDAYVECPPEKKLSTAGSVFALYNMDTPQRRTTDARSQLYNTMPRKRKRIMVETPQNTVLGPSLAEWYGGAGSVKNLVDIYQQQVNEHYFQQDLLQGKLSTADISQHQRKSLYPDINNISPCCSPKVYDNQGYKVYNEAKRKSDECEVTQCSSLTMVSPEEFKDKKCESLPDSDMVEDWVDNELFRIQSTLSQEVFEALDEKKEDFQSPLLFDDKHSTPSTNKKIPKIRKKPQNKQKQPCHIEEFYIDDELSPETHRLLGKKTARSPNTPSVNLRKQGKENRRHVDYIRPLREDFENNQVSHRYNQNKQRPDQTKYKSVKDQHYNSANSTDVYERRNNYKENCNPNYRKSRDQQKYNRHYKGYDRQDNGECYNDNSRVKYKSDDRERPYDSDNSLDSLRAERQLTRLHTSFHSVPQQYNEYGEAASALIPDTDTYPRIVEAISETDQQKLKKKVEEQAAFASCVVVETNTRYPDQHRVTHTLTDLTDGTTSTLYGKNVKATRLMSAMIAP